MKTKEIAIEAIKCQIAHVEFMEKHQRASMGERLESIAEDQKALKGYSDLLSMWNELLVKIEEEQ